jgi:hypothetical protein
MPKELDRTFKEFGGKGGTAFSKMLKRDNPLDATGAEIK